MIKLTIEDLAEKVNEILEDHFKTHPEMISDARQSNILSTRRIRDYLTKGLIPKPFSTGEGKQKWFDQTHIDALVALRLLQHNGLSEQYISKELDKNSVLNESFYASSDNTESSIPNNSVLTTNSINNLQSDALQFLNSLKNNTQSPENRDSKSLSNNIGFSASIANSLNLKSYTTEGIQSQPLSSEQLKIATTPSLLSSTTIENNKFTNDELLKSLSNYQGIKSNTYTEYCIDDNLGIFLKISSKNNPLTQKMISEHVKNEITKLLNNQGAKND